MTHFLGIDPGLEGAFVLLTESGRPVEFVDMPLDRGNKNTANYDPYSIHSLIRKYSRLPHLRVALEWPQTRPGEGAQRCRNFGLGLGYVEMACLSLGLPVEKIAPLKWKNTFSLPAKEKDPQLKLHLAVFDTFFGAYRDQVTGPRGGIKDGRLEACLIAEHLRRRTAAGMRATVARFGRGSAEAMSMVLGAGRRRKNRPSS